MNVTITGKHPMRVYIQPEGDCQGVYVTNKTTNGFDVVELRGGTSNITFQRTVVCNRADENMGNGRISRNADFRFDKAATNEPTMESSGHEVQKDERKWCAVVSKSVAGEKTLTPGTRKIEGR